jgi:hypothetical protein
VIYAVRRSLIPGRDGRSSWNDALYHIYERVNVFIGHDAKTLSGEAPLERSYVVEYVRISRYYEEEGSSRLRKYFLCAEIENPPF